MRSGRSFLILLVLAGAIGAYAYFVESKHDTTTPAPKHDKVFTNADSSKIDTLEVHGAGGDVTSLKKKGDDWQITAPVAADADNAEVNSLVSTLSSLEAQRTVEENPTAVAGYGLAPARFSVAYRLAGDPALHRLNVGNKTPTGSDTYAQVEGQPKLFLISSYLEDSLNRSTFDLRDKTVLKFARETVDGLTIEPTGGPNVVLAKKGNDWRLTAPLDARADFGGVDGMISRISSTKMKSLVAPGSRPPAAPAKDAKDTKSTKDTKDTKESSPKPEAKPETATAEAKPAAVSTDYSEADLKAYGLDKPQLVAIVASGSTRASLAIGGKYDDASVYARDLSRPLVFTVDKGVLDDLKKKPDDLRIKDVFEFRTFTATAVDLTYGGATYGFSKQKADVKDASAAADVWKQTKPAAKDVDQTKITDLLTTLSNLRADTFVDKALASGEDLTVAATFNDGTTTKTETVTLRKSGTTAQTVHPGEAGAGVVSAADVDKAIGLLKAIAGIK